MPSPNAQAFFKSQLAAHLPTPWSKPYVVEPIFQEWRNKCHFFLDKEWQAHYNTGMDRTILAIFANSLPHTSFCLPRFCSSPRLFLSCSSSSATLVQMDILKMALKKRMAAAVTGVGMGHEELGTLCYRHLCCG